MTFYDRLEAIAFRAARCGVVTMLQEKPSPAFKAHKAAIERGEITKSNVIGIRKLLNGASRRADNLSIGMSTPKGTMAQADELLSLIYKHHPRVVGELHASGIKVLQNPRYKKRWGSHESHVIAGLSGFELVDYEWLGSYHTVPVYRAHSIDGASFDFRNVPWQSGGDGPEVVR